MIHSSKQDYSYALDNDGNLVNVLNAQAGGSYKCPHCNEVMIPRQGKVRKWHFAHKANLSNCCYETYLHKIAKKRIKDTFLSSKQFNIGYDTIICCNNRNCIMAKHSGCKASKYKEYNLKEFYDICEEEKGYNNFIADLKLSSSSAKDREPILIEIYVKHKCTENKIKDGVRIIEIQIKAEEDIDEICSKQLISGKRYSDFGDDESPKNIFYNFNKINEESPVDNKSLQRRKYYFWYKNNGKYGNGNCRCIENEAIRIHGGANYVVSTKKFDLRWALLELLRKDVQVKNCMICEHFGFNDDKGYCRKAWNLGIRQCLPVQVARMCKYYSVIKNANKLGIPYDDDFKYEEVVRNREY